MLLLYGGLSPAGRTSVYFVWCFVCAAAYKHVTTQYTIVIKLNDDDKTTKPEWSYYWRCINCFSFLHSRSPPLLHACMCVWVCFILFIMFSIRRQMNTTTISADVPSTNSTNGFFLSAFSIPLRMDWINNCSVLCVSPFNESFGCQYNVYCIRFKMI